MYLIYIMLCYCVLLQDGYTALHTAAGGGHRELCNWLLAHYPDHDMISKTNNVSEQIIQFSIFTVVM